MSPMKLFITTCLLMLINTPAIADKSEMNDPAQAVRQTEQAFAETMELRDFDKFLSFISDEAVFFSGSAALRGKQKVAEAWQPFFKEPAAPFSWQPEVVQVLDSGTLALSSGPVHDATGKLVGTFTSIWRLNETTHKWQIIFDKGNDACNCEKP
jgi:ketosteroid isomerase-like protein